MGTGAKAAAAVAGGLLLGRSKKQKLALAVGGLLLSRKVDPGNVLKQGSDLVENNPELARLTEQVRGTLVQAARAAAVSTVSNRLEALSDSLHERSEQIRAGKAAPEEGAEEEPEAEEEEEEPEAEAEEEPEEEEPEEEEEEEPEEEEHEEDQEPEAE